MTRGNTIAFSSNIKLLLSDPICKQSGSCKDAKKIILINDEVRVKCQFGRNNTYGRTSPGCM